MKLIKKISRLEVKRCFAITPYIRKYGIASVRSNKIPSRAKYLVGLNKAKRDVLKTSEAKLDRTRGLATSKKRLHAYNTLDWYIGTVSTKEVGAWKRAGGLPFDWTRGSLARTAKLVEVGLREGSKKIRKRSKRAIPGIIAFKDIIKKDKYLLPILFKSGLGTNGRKGLPKMKADIDDGNMRAIALTISGAKTLKAYIGMPPKNS
ncbi:MAG TPA: hypothetical protein VI953_01850 [Candidatus Paceibacterota bacterium]|uniref:Uncharacterized protein n=1 Tax=Candidatus Wildermuthbacteria bacterium RIFCSPHIGHO2_01_FULL_49_22b TaxID=1802448 RepID=A0A1G2QY03_9BACT|nr:MAG: hypothetical protein A2672_00525 [Candidatus Wildermuthbacteria bacterium RIFCSPHIGHO2_01_FULL_49_22b]